jgi:acylphosphatase
MMARAHLWISGNVQGVNFRYYLSEQARMHSVGGWARNLPDGRVEAVLEGIDKDVDTVVDWCSEGPPSATVTDLEVARDEELENLTEFDLIW